MKKVLLASTVLGGLLLGSFALAQEANTSSNQTNVVTVATVNIYNAKINSQDGNKIKLSFDLSNRTGTQPGVEYAVQLIKEEKNAQILADEKIYSDLVNLDENQTIKEEIEYVAPEYLNGKFKVWIIAENDSGLLLSLANLGEITLQGDNQYVEINARSCYLKVDGEAGNKKYASNQGVDIKDSEKLIATCDVINNFASPITVTPQIKTYWRSAFGKAVADNQEPQSSISLKSKEKKTISLTLPKANVPQAYDAVLTLTDDQNKIISNKATFHYVLSGASATIQNITLDKNYYAAGETAKAFLYWSPSVGNFPGSRLGTTNEGKIFSNIVIQNKDNQACSDTVKNELNANNASVNYDIPIKAECIDPVISVSILDDKGNILDKKDLNLKSQNIPQKPLQKPLEKSKQENGISTKAIVAIVILAILLAIVIALLFKKRKAGLSIFLILAGGLLLIGDKAKADTMSVTMWSNTTTPYTQTFTISLNKPTYAPNETVVASGTANKVSTCSNPVSEDMEAYQNTNPSNKQQIFYTADIQFGTELKGSKSFSAENSAGDYYMTFEISVNAVETETGYYVKGSGYDSASIKYSVVAPPTVSLTASPSWIVLGDSATLTYVIGNNPDFCIASSQSGNPGDWSWTKNIVNGTYSVQVTPGSIGQKFYYLTCSNYEGNAESNANIWVCPVGQHFDGSKCVSNTCINSCPSGTKQCPEDGSASTPSVSWHASATGVCTVAECECYVPIATPCDHTCNCNDVCEGQKCYNGCHEECSGLGTKKCTWREVNP